LLPDETKLKQAYEKFWADFFKTCGQLQEENLELLAIWQSEPICFSNNNICALRLLELSFESRLFAFFSLVSFITFKILIIFFKPF
jgi:hypothetical protein